MVNRNRGYVIAAVIIILIGLVLIAIPRDRLILHEEYTSLESYPEFYHTNFTVSSSEVNPELILDFDIDYADSYSSYTVLWMLLQLTLEQFNEDFNITEAHSAMSGEDWNLDPYWHGWFTGPFSPMRDVINPGAYTIAFWIDTDGAMSGWSVTLTATLRTSFFPML